MSLTDAGTPNANPSIGELTDRIRASEPRCGTTRVILIDGPAGAGKSTLANRLAISLGGQASAGAGTYDPAASTSADAGDVSASPVQIIHGDDMYEGWDGLESLHELLLGEVLEPLSRGDAAGFHMWDWVNDRRSHEILVPPRPYLILEGVGVAQRAARAYASLIMWVEAPWDTRLQRGVERDHMAYEDVVDKWRVFEAEQNVHHEREATRAAAHVVIDGTLPLPAELEGDSE